MPLRGADRPGGRSIQRTFVGADESPPRNEGEIWAGGALESMGASTAPGCRFDPGSALHRWYGTGIYLHLRQPEREGLSAAQPAARSIRDSGVRSPTVRCG